MDFTHTIMICIANWVYLVQNYGNFPQTDHITWYVSDVGPSVGADANTPLRGIAVTVALTVGVFSLYAEVCNSNSLHIAQAIVTFIVHMYDV